VSAVVLQHYICICRGRPLSSSRFGLPRPLATVVHPCTSSLYSASLAHLTTRDGGNAQGLRFLRSNTARSPINKKAPSWGFFIYGGEAGIVSGPSLAPRPSSTLRATKFAILQICRTLGRLPFNGFQAALTSLIYKHFFQNS
jgi:hypothetical protein